MPPELPAADQPLRLGVVYGILALDLISFFHKALNNALLLICLRRFVNHSLIYFCFPTGQHFVKIARKFIVFKCYHAIQICCHAVDKSECRICRFFSIFIWTCVVYRVKSLVKCRCRLYHEFNVVKCFHFDYLQMFGFAFLLMILFYHIIRIMSIILCV